MSSQTASTEGTTGTTGGSLGMLRHLIIVVNKSLQEILLYRHLKIWCGLSKHLNSGGGSVVEEGSVNTDEASDQADQQVMNNL